MKKKSMQKQLLKKYSINAFNRDLESTRFIFETFKSVKEKFTFKIQHGKKTHKIEVEYLPAEDIFLYDDNLPQAVERKLDKKLSETFNYLRLVDAF